MADRKWSNHKKDFSKGRFRIKFNLLSRASDKAYRVLSSSGEEMYIDDIVNEINKEQSKYNLKIYNRESLSDQH